MKTCNYCNKEIISNKTFAKFCNSICGYRFRRGISLIDTTLNKECIYCNKSFLNKRANQKYCNHNCCNNNKLGRNPNNTNTTKKTCPTCNILFLSRGPSHIYCNKKCNTNERLKNILRNRLNSAIRNNQKAGSAVKDLGCTIEEFKVYLEKQFFNNPRTHESMTWDNHTLDGWHIDHILPLDSFNLTNREETIKACHYSNLRPLWAKENIIKSNKLLDDIIIEITQ
ncbi:hypothetical protein UFOVP53_230 [uncultured Caudovirales phage]|uniref:HNHc domain containing protein n=1 Tax=uncultured Caudovirales phage TaxID=2100421 RepID=A0A6J5KXS5_9CAUD|nr:hypothetical protein UFOVP53_230 [uncultured Caudovirales phage]